MRTTRFALLLALAFTLAVTAAGCAGSGNVTGMTFTVTERMTGEGPLGTCSFETASDPLPKPDAEALAFSVGTVLGVSGDFIQSCGGSTGGACQPVGDSEYEWFLVGKPNWSFERKPTADLNGLNGELSGLLTTTSAGTGGIGVHYGNTTFGPLSLESFKPDILKVTAFAAWAEGQPAPQESVIATTVKAGSKMNLILRAFDRAGGRLCGRGPVDTTGSTGLTLAGDRTMGAPAPKANSVIVLTFADAGTATLKLAFGGASLTQDFDVRP
ncbi:MAG TPA: hypothetical protein VGK67_28125 [Myxococcales bacterium]|jgi:hypothetical protein